jgi:hypothetical protein
MPPILKKLVDISVWILFVVGCIALIFGIVVVTFTRAVPVPLTRAVPTPRIWLTPLWGLGVFSLFLSVVAAWFRKVIR